MPTGLRLTTITFYPVKSMQGCDLPWANVAPRGLENDRLLMVTDPGGRFFTQRELPKLAAIVPRLGADSLTLSAPGMDTLILTLAFTGPVSTVSIWDDEADAVDQGNAVADWLSQFLGVKVRLVRMPEGYMRAVSRRYAVTARDQVGFADGFPLLLVSQESLDALNSRMQAPLPMNRFRPNLVVQGCEPFAEDGWKRIRIGGVDLALVKPCARCAVTTHDQATGERTGKEPLATLARFRRSGNKALFAMNAIPVTLGEIRLGDAVEVMA